MLRLMRHATDKPLGLIARRTQRCAPYSRENGSPLSGSPNDSERQLDGRMGTPDEVAGGIAFIASDDGRFINGSELVMDGGLTAQ